MSRAETIDLADLPVDMARPDAIAVGTAPGPSTALREAVRRYEAALLQETLARSRRRGSCLAVCQEFQTSG